VKFEFKMKRRGPLFDGKGLTAFGKAVNAGIKETAQKGEERLAFKLRPQGSTNLTDNNSGVFKTRSYYIETYGPWARNQASSGDYRRNLSVKVTDLHAVIEDGNKVYGPWLEGTSSRNRGRFRGYRQFRITEDYLKDIMPKVLTQHVERFARKMNA